MTMNKIAMVRYLLDEIEAEKELHRKFELAEEKARKEAEQNEGNYWSYFGWEGRQPTRSRIEDNCKLARRLLIEISRER